MLRLKTIFAIIIFLAPYLLHAQDDGLLKWSAARRLEWNDYKGEPDERSQAAASTSTQIGFEYHIRDNKLTYAITCKFSKAKSWGRYKSDYILSHEQGHFDIAEIFARKLVKGIKEYTFNPDSYKTDLRKIYSDVMHEKEKFQQQYDNETDYSRIKVKQEEWLKKIAETLTELKDYSDY